MVDSLITFKENEYIYASDMNDNFNFVLDKVTTNAAQLTTYLEGEVSSIQSNVASVQATLQGNIDSANTATNNLKTDVYTKGFLPNYSAGVSISTNYTTTKNGWVRWYTESNDGTDAYLKVNGVNVGISRQYKYHNHKTLMFLVSKGDKITFDKGTVTFYPCKGGI